MSCPRLQHNDPAWFRTQTSWSKSSALPIWQWIFHKKRVGRLSVIEIVNGTYSAKDETHTQCTSHFSYSLHKVTARNFDQWRDKHTCFVSKLASASFLSVSFLDVSKSFSRAWSFYCMINATNSDETCLEIKSLSANSNPQKHTQNDQTKDQVLTRFDPWLPPETSWGLLTSEQGSHLSSERGKL